VPEGLLVLDLSISDYDDSMIHRVAFLAAMEVVFSDDTTGVAHKHARGVDANTDWGLLKDCFHSVIRHEVDFHLVHVFEMRLKASATCVLLGHVIGRVVVFECDALISSVLVCFKHPSASAIVVGQWVAVDQLLDRVLHRYEVKP